MKIISKHIPQLYAILWNKYRMHLFMHSSTFLKLHSFALIESCYSVVFRIKWWACCLLEDMVLSKNVKLTSKDTVYHFCWFLCISWFVMSAYLFLWNKYDFTFYSCALCLWLWENIKMVAYYTVWYNEGRNVLTYTMIIIWGKLHRLRVIQTQASLIHSHWFHTRAARWCSG